MEKIQEQILKYYTQMKQQCQKIQKEVQGHLIYQIKKNRKVLIPIDVNKLKDTGDLFGTLTEEVSHGKDALEGRQDKKVAEDKSNDEKGLESLGRPANDYVKNKLGDDNNSNISLTTDGIDLTNADVGEKVGDVIQLIVYVGTGGVEKVLRIDPNGQLIDVPDLFGKTGEFTLGALKAGGEDLSLNTYKIPKRFQYNTLPYKYGELFGHSTMSALGILGFFIGSGMEGGGLLVAPETGGSSLAVASLGGVVEGYSAGVTTTSAINFGKVVYEIKAMKNGESSSESSSTEVSDEKNSDNLQKEETIKDDETSKNRNLEDAASKVQELSDQIKIELKKNKNIIEVTRDGQKMYYDKKSKCYFYVDKTHSYLHYEVFDRTGKHIGVIDGEELKEALKSGKEIKNIVNKKGAKLGRTAKVK